MRRSRLFGILNTAIATVVTSIASAAPITAGSIATVGDLYAGTGATFINGISADGSTAVGDSAKGAADQAFLWTASGGIAALGSLTPGTSSRAYGVSADGGVIVGYGVSTKQEAMKWTAATGMKGLGLFNNLATAANGVSAHGGTIAAVQQGGPLTAIISPNGGDTFTSVAGLAGFSSAFTSVSANGKTFVGSGTTLTSRAIRYSTSGGIDVLGLLPSTTLSQALAVSANGNVVVGFSRDEFTRSMPFLWTPTQGMISLGRLPGAAFSEADAISYDGSIVVGRGGPAGYDKNFLWTKTTGLLNLKDFLATRYGLSEPFAGNYLVGKPFLSADGRTIGVAYRSDTNLQQGAVIKLPDVLAISPAIQPTQPSGQNLYAAGVVYPLDSKRPSALTIYDTDNNAGTLSFSGFAPGARVSVLLDFSFGPAGVNATTFQEVLAYLSTANAYKDFEVVTADPLLSVNTDFDVLLT